uniref:Transmembrane protein 222a n=1 Tax=Cyprinodon variegatus TaxID=28743 RepID=A0A3Q2DD66_CYPVA
MAEVEDTDIMMSYQADFLKSGRKSSRYPYCIVWTPIPILSWVLPFIGHMGICTSSGVIRDFAGSYFVSVLSYFYRPYNNSISPHVAVSPEHYYKTCDCLYRRITWGLVDLQSFGDLMLIRFVGMAQLHGTKQSMMHLRNTNAGRYECTYGRSFFCEMPSGTELFTRLIYVFSVFPQFASKHNLCLDNCHSHVAMALNLMRYDNCTSWNMVNLCVLSFIHGKHVSWAAVLKTWLPFVMLCGVLATFILTLNLQ